jgi:nicotinamide phosphoribosyltransferase
VWGDGLNLDRLRRIYIELERRGLSADNIFCGMGGGLLQQCNRDSLNFGQKANAVCINGTWMDVCKTPTGDTMKRSKPGRLALQYVDGDYRTVPRDSIPAEENVLVPVFRNGKLLRTWDFTELIERSERDVPEYYYADVIEPMRESVPVGV